MDAAKIRRIELQPLAPARPSGAIAPPGGHGVAQGAGSTSFSATVDDLLLARAKRGDEGAMEKLYRAFETPVFTLARRICRTPQDAEEVLQETFLEMFRSLRRFRGEGSFAGWIRRIATNKALMRLRYQRSRGGEAEELDEELPEERWRGGTGPAPELAAANARLDLEGALARLSDDARVVIWLHEVEGYSHDEIGEMLGKTASFSKSQLARGYARLRGYLAPLAREEACT